MLTDVRNGTDRALAMAINRVAPRIRTAMSQAVRQQVALRASYVDAALELQRARIGRMRASISTPDRGVPLVQYMTSSRLMIFKTGKPATKRLIQAPFVRVAAGGMLRAPGEAFAGVDAETLRQALFAAKIASYTQGFAMLRAASVERDYGIDLAEVARIWTAGCIIRAGFLGVIRDVFQQDPELPLLALAPALAPRLQAATPALRRVVSAAALAGLPVPALSASLSWLDTLTTVQGSANVIQAQRDYFGSHTYRRRDAPDVPVHTEWPRRPAEAGDPPTT